MATTSSQREISLQNGILSFSEESVPVLVKGAGSSERVLPHDTTYAVQLLSCKCFCQSLLQPPETPIQQKEAALTLFYAETARLQ